MGLKSLIDCAKSESEQLIAHLENVTGLEFVENDGFSRKICKSCYNRAEQFAEFKELCSLMQIRQIRPIQSDLKEEKRFRKS